MRRRNGFDGAGEQRQNRVQKPGHRIGRDRTRNIDPRLGVRIRGKSGEARENDSSKSHDDLSIV